MRTFNPSRTQSKFLSRGASVDSTEKDYTLTFDSRDIYLTDIIDHQSILSSIETINAINKLDDFEYKNYAVINCEYNPPPINIYINSVGGDAMAALGLITVIESSETPIHTHCIGEASSAALFIFSVGHVRYAYKHSIFMYHQISTGTYGTFKDIEETVETIKHLQERLEDIFSTYTNFTKKELEDIRVHKKDYTFYYQEALEKGLADKVTLSSIYTKDLEELKDNNKINIISSNEEVEEDSEFLDQIEQLSNEELSLAIKQFIQNKNDLDLDAEK